MTDTPKDPALAVLEAGLAEAQQELREAQQAVALSETLIARFTRAIEACETARADPMPNSERAKPGAVEFALTNHLSANRAKASDLIATFPQFKSPSILAALKRMLAKGTIILDGTPDHGTYSIVRKDGAE